MNSSLLPASPTWVEYDLLFKDPTFGADAARRALTHEGLHVEPKRVVNGTNLVFRAGPDRWLKIYAPLEEGALKTEAAMLDAVAGRLGVATPEIAARGQVDGWGYLLLSHVEGVPFSTARPSMSDRDRNAIAIGVGSALNRLHAIEIDAIAPPSDWPRFLDERIRNAPERARKHGADERWERLIREWIARHEEVMRSTGAPVPLHADLYFDHLLVAERGGSWELSGIIDFADARYGAREYELVNPLLWLVRGERDAITAMLSAYFGAGVPIDHALAERLMAWTLVHEFFRFDNWFRSELEDPSVTTIEAIVDRVLPVGIPFGDDDVATV